MKRKLVWGVLIVFYLGVIAMTLFVKTPDEIIAMLVKASSNLKVVSLITHILFILTLSLVIAVKKYRSLIIAGFISFICITAICASALFGIIPNIFIFSTFIILTIHAYRHKYFNFDFKSIPVISWIVSVLSLLFGFWYLHWIDFPMMLNALFYSPLGVANCPTMLAICGFLCLSSKPRFIFLEITVALFTLYFGIFGIISLGANIDVVLIISSVFLLSRIGLTAKKKNTQVVK